MDLQAGDGPWVVETMSEWTRSGAETYSLVFAVRGRGSIDRLFRLKACVAFALGTGLDGILQGWLSRRAALEAVGVETPRLHASGQGVILEEEIPFDLATALRSEGSEGVRLGLVDLIVGLSRLGFSPRTGFSGIRSRGRDAVIVDFGQDLGDPDHPLSCPEIIFDVLVDHWATSGCGLTTEQIASMRMTFARRIGADPAS